MPRDVAVSNTGIVMVRPVIKAANFDDAERSVTIQVEPLVRKGQRVALSMTDADPGGQPPNSQLLETKVEGDTKELTFESIEVPSGRYLLRLNIDDAESLLTRDPTGLLVGPEVAVP